MTHEQSEQEEKVAEFEEERVDNTNATDPPPHPSPAEGGTTEASPRPPRPSKAEGER